MPWQKGKSGNPKGRKAGKPNRTTTEFKDALTRALNNADLEEMLKDTPADRRIEALCKLAEFAHPKLGRQEVTGKDGGPVTLELGIHAPDTK